MAPQMKFAVIVQNTSSIPLTINSFAGNIIANDTIIGNVYNFSPVAIPANGQSIILVTAQLQVIGLVSDLFNVWQYRNTQQDVKIQGFANAGFIQIPINLKFSIG